MRSASCCCDRSLATRADFILRFFICILPSARFDYSSSSSASMIVTAEVNEFVVGSAANIPGVITAPVNTINVYDILKYDKMVIAKDALAKLEEVYA